MAREFWMVMCIPAYIMDTTALSAEENGAYFRVLMELAKTGGETEFDEERLRRITGLSPKRWAVAWKWIAEFFEISEGLIRASAGHAEFRSRWSSDGPDYGADWPEIRRRIVARDGGKCTKCDATGALDVHHIRPLRLFDGDVAAANRDDNLVALCRPCHTAADAEFRRTERA